MGRMHLLPAGACLGFAGPQAMLPQIVLGVLSAWGVVIFGSMKIFGGKKEAAPEPAK